MEWLVAGKVTSHFQGTLKRGLKEGHGYQRSSKGFQYEGGYVAGERSGQGVAHWDDQTHYEGEWDAGKKHGTGHMTYATGGSYAGQWKKDLFHGRGKAIYAGGRVVDGEFSEGRPIGQVPAVAPAQASPLRHGISPRIPTGSLIQSFAVRGSLPSEKSWSELSEQEQRRISSTYQLLHEDDEPPYPASGTANLYGLISEGQNKILAKGALSMNVLIDSDGKPVSATVFQSPDPAITRVATFVALKEKYKPALCSATPCAMVFPVRVMFSVE